MPTNLKKLGVDIEEFFDPYVSGDMAIATGFTVDDADINTLFAPYVSGDLAPATGFEVDGADINTLFAPSGGGGGPGLIPTPGYDGANYFRGNGTSNGNTDPITAYIHFELLDDGTYTVTGISGVFSSGVWFDPAVAGLDTDYEVRYTASSSDGGDIVNPASGFTQIGSAGALELSYTWPGGLGDDTKNFTVTVDIRPTGGSIESTGTFNALCFAYRESGA
jgi:hypothetical protein